MSKIIFLCSSSDLNWVDEYSEEHHFLNDGYVLEYEFGNSYITELIDDVKYIYVIITKTTSYTLTQKKY